MDATSNRGDTRIDVPLGKCENIRLRCLVGRFEVMGDLIQCSAEARIITAVHLETIEGIYDSLG